MNTLVCFSRPDLACTLRDYLISQRLSCVVHEVDRQYCLVLDDAVDMEQAKAITDHFVNAPHDPRYQAASWENNRRPVFTSRCDRPSSNLLQHSQIKAQLIHYPLTCLILLINIVMFGLMTVSIETRIWVDSMMFILPLNELQ